MESLHKFNFQAAFECKACIPLRYRASCKTCNWPGIFRNCSMNTAWLFGSQRQEIAETHFSRRALSSSLPRPRLKRTASMHCVGAVFVGAFMSTRSCSPFCPPRIRLAVDKSSFSPLRDSNCHDTFRSSGKTATMQSQTGNGKVERNRGNAGSPIRQAAWSQDQGNVAEEVGTKKTNIKCGIMQVTQRRVGYPKCQGEPIWLSGQVGEPDVRKRKEWP